MLTLENYLSKCQLTLTTRSPNHISVFGILSLQQNDSRRFVFVNDFVIRHLSSEIKRAKKRREISLQEEATRKEPLTHEDTIADTMIVWPEDAAIESNLKGTIERAVKESSLESEKVAFLRLYFEGYSPEEIGKKLGYTRKRIQQIEANAMDKLESLTLLLPAPPSLSSYSLLSLFKRFRGDLHSAELAAHGANIV